MKILEVLTPKRRIGNFGERKAALYLVLHGYRILERNFISSDHEIDIIAKKGDTVAFIEVKTRNAEKENPSEPRPASAVTPEKQRGIISAANAFPRYRYGRVKMRFDIIEVLYELKNKKEKVRQIKHLVGAFDKNSAYKRPWER